jgi:hypothetical protein
LTPIVHEFGWRLGGSFLRIAPRNARLQLIRTCGGAGLWLRRPPPAYARMGARRGLGRRRGYLAIIYLLTGSTTHRAGAGSARALPLTRGPPGITETRPPLGGLHRIARPLGRNEGELR